VRERKEKQDIVGLKNKNLSGAAKKRLQWLMKNKGLSYKEAREKCQEAMPVRDNPKLKRSSTESTPDAISKKPRTEGLSLPKAIGDKPEGLGREAAQSTSFKEAPESIKVGVMHADHPESTLTGDQMKAFKKSIFERIKDGTEAIKPSFSGLQFKSGWISVICSNPETEKWLMKIVPEVKPWDGANLKAVGEKDFPKFHAFMAFFPESHDEPNEDILKLVEGQNDGLNATHWVIVKRNEEKTAAQLILLIDETQLNKLKAANYRINYKFGKVTLYPRSEKKKPTVVAKQSTSKYP